MSKLNCSLSLTASILALLVSAAMAGDASSPGVDGDDEPRIINIVNFIRLLEPRDASITEDVLRETVICQIELMKAHHLPGTFLLQYDALIDPRYQGLLKSLPRDQFEIGAWWELPQPLVEKAGLKWRGRYPWDWHANVGFVSGYTPEERKKLVDVYMADFKDVFGYYPKSVASWFIDEHTLTYLHEKYGVIASANCKDQVGTDGYTLWGGYWNQAYYPSKLNSFMPAQTEEGQIPLPVFRMLGSDPVRQYSTGIGASHQGVISLEPVYRDSGGDTRWVDWFLKNLVEGECLAFNYAQAGQENSFTWNGMRNGLGYQFPQIAKLRDEGKLRVEKLCESGEWFRRTFKTTPATSMAYLKPLKDSDDRAVWFNSRFYRLHVTWDSGRMLIRDVHLFDEAVTSPIYRERLDAQAVSFLTLPFVDGYYWSSSDRHAGIKLVANIDGQDIELQGGAPSAAEPLPGILNVTWPLKDRAGQFVITLSEENADFTLHTSPEIDWSLQLAVADGVQLPFTRATPKKLSANFEGSDYQVELRRGIFHLQGSRLRIQPDCNRISLDLSKRRPKP
jgi:hypothetical protein